MKDSVKSNGIQDRYRVTTMQIENCVVTVRQPVLSREDREKVEEQVKHSMLLFAEAAEAEKETEEAV